MLDTFKKKHKDWKKRRYLKHFGVNEVDQSDVEYIVKQYIHDTRAGHYASLILKEPDVENRLKEMISCVVSGFPVPTQNKHGLYEFKQQSYWIYGSSETGTIGFVKFIEAEYGSGQNNLEIHMFGIKEEFRRQGHGKNMLAEILRGGMPGQKYFARCYPHSQAMFLMLESVGFKHVGIQPRGTRELTFSL